MKYKIAVIASGQELGLLDYRGERKCKASNALRNFTSAPLAPPARERERERDDERNGMKHKREGASWRGCYFQPSPTQISLAVRFRRDRSGAERGQA